MRAHSFKDRLSGERGAAILMFTLMTWLVVIPMVGMSIDGAIIFFAQQRLSAAVDAAALAGGRAFTADTTVISQTTAINDTVSRYFYANFPNGFLGTKNTSVPTTQIIDNQTTRVRTVKVTAGSDVALYFMPILGYGVSHISASAQTSRRDINVVLVLDRSGSMGNACAPMKTAAQSFVDGFSDGNDAVGLVTFVAVASADFPTGKDFKSRTPKNLKQTLSTLSCSGSTNSSEALMRGQTQILVNSKPGTLDVIVFFTDGNPHGFSTYLKLKSNATCPSPLATSPGYVSPAEMPSDDSTKYVKAAVTSGSGLLPIPAASASRGVTAGDPTSFTLSATNCNTSNPGNMANQFDGYPLNDLYGNATNHYTNSSVNNGSVIWFPTMTYNAGGKINITSDNAWLASKSAAYSAAKNIRAAGTRVYTMGLGSNGGVDNILLREMANDQASDEYDLTKPQGRYVYASDPGQIASAFNSIKSELLRLSQ